MDLYTFSLALGGIGLGTMAVAGLGARGGAGRASGGHHNGGSSHAHGGAHGGHAHGGHAQGAHAAPGGAHHHDVADIRAVQMPGVGPALSALVSPRIIFSFLVGFGAAGLLIGELLGGGVVRLVSAALVGILFERLVVAPLWRFAHRFESSPALTLESSITDDAQAVSSFDARGQGLVSIELDGQVVQVLGTLRSEDLQAGVRVRAGDRLRIEAVDGARNRCTVSYLGA
jgi:fumarate reductase subunit D